MYTDLKSAIKDKIKQNGDQEITGQLLQDSLLSIINVVGKNATFAGVAGLSTVPGTPAGPLFYITGDTGVFPNFGGVKTNGISVISNQSGAWVATRILDTSELTREKAVLVKDDALKVKSIHKTYQTEAEALADKNPIDPTTSLPLTVGQFVSIVDDGEKNGIYRIGSIGVDGTMSLELQGKLGDLSDYANHGYDATPKTLKEVDDEVAQLESYVEQLAYVKIKNEAVNGNFENGLIAPFSKTDAYEGASTLAINSSTPISGNYDIRLTIITPSTGSRPQLRGLDGAGNIGDKIYLHFYAKILSGVPMISAINNGVNGSIIYKGNVMNGRNTRIIDVVGTGDNLGLIYFNSPSVWDMQMDHFMRINLTETFGAGNEPTEEEMNLIISNLAIDYFEGEIAIPSQKIMQWQQELIVSKITKSQAIQILKQQDSNLIFQGFAKPSDDTPSATLNHTYFVIESGTVFEVEATEGQVLVGNGIEFEARTINEKASINDVLTLSNRGGISVKGVFPSPPPLKVGECYLHEKDFNVYIQGETSRDVIEMNIGDVIGVKGVRYVKTADGWDVEKNAKDKLEYENVNAIYSYADGGVITKEDVNGWGCGSINVKKGDIFSIKGVGGNSSRLWIYQDSEGNDIDVAPSNATWLDIPYSFICTHDGVIYYNSHPTYLSTSEVYCTAKTLEIPETPEEPEKIETNKINIKAIAKNRLLLDSYNSGDIFFSTTTGRLYENIDGDSVDITDEAIEKDYDLFNEQDKTTYKILNGWIRPKGVISNVSFFPDYTLNDVTNDIVDFTFNQMTMEEVYAKYDNLASEYPDFVEKIDAAELVGIPYPRYANGILEGDAEYAKTPAYKTYMYKFSSYSTSHGHDRNHQKFKIFIISGAHGIEKVGPITTYLFAKQLCEATTPNYFNLRSAFDVYIVPCLNGYGIYNGSRVNANGVDINRNYPTKRWILTEDNGVNYSGAEKGSEFETQLVVALTDLIKPHVPMDWHNYGGGARQFYTTPLSEIGGKISYKALVDISYALIKSHPSYFGTKYQLFVESEANILPVHPVNPAGTSTDFWYHERSNHFGATYEVSNGINFLDGVYNPNRSDLNGADTLSIAEYTIRTFVMRIAEYVSQSGVNAVNNWLA